MTRTARFASPIALLGLAVTPLSGQAFAQATGDRAATGGGMSAAPTEPTSSTTRTTRDEGTSYGWLGLLGLAGLAGLMPRKPHTVKTTNHRRGDTTTR